jgi:hypothetical protein
MTMSPPSQYMNIFRPTFTSIPVYPHPTFSIHIQHPCASQCLYVPPSHAELHHPPHVTPSRIEQSVTL